LEEFISRYRSLKPRTMRQSLSLALGFGLIAIAIAMCTCPPTPMNLGESTKYLGAVAALITIGAYAFCKSLPGQKYGD